MVRSRAAAYQIPTVDITEATCFRLLGMMQSSSPIDGDVALLTVQASGAFHTATSANTTEFEKTIKNGAIVTDVVFALLAHVAIHIVGRDLLEEIDIVVRVELCHFASSGRFGALKSSQKSGSHLPGVVPKGALT